MSRQQTGRFASKKQLFGLFLIAIAAGAAACWFLFNYERSEYPYASIIDSAISPEAIEKRLYMFAGKLHRAGTRQNEHVGRAILKELKQLGFHVSVEPMSVRLPEPAEARLEIVHPAFKNLDLHERVLPEDPYSAAATSDVPYFAFTPDFDFASEVVYANFGEEDDYAVLKQNGIDVTGKILLVRAQGICRGMKGLLAEQHGVSGLLIYPELRDQGFVKPAYPKGPHINPWTVEEGSFLRFFLYPGLPKNLKRNTEGSESSVWTLPKIPALPISQQTALEILRGVNGSPSPKNWHGLMPVSYGIGSGPVQVRMAYRSHWNEAVLNNIIATFSDFSSPEPPVVVGCHYDAWWYGASDPGSGTAAVLQAAEAFSRIRTRGWKPRRQIYFAFWDGEEFGMFGSTHWVEQSLASGTKIAAYVNVDSAYRAREFVGNVMPGLRSVLDGVLSKMKDPGTGKILADIRGEFQLPGFSSDTTPFIALAGIPTAEIGYGRFYGVYHSIYDNLNWMTKFGDPKFAYHVSLSKILTLYLMQLSGNELLPYRFSEVSDYARQVLFELNVEAKQLEKLNASVEKFAATAARIDPELISNRNYPAPTVHSINARLVEAMNAFAVDPSTPVLPFRQRSLLLGASEKTGCGSDSLPALFTALNEKNSAKIDQESERLTQAFIKAEKILSDVERTLKNP